MKMNLHRAQELIEPLRKGTAIGVSKHWQARLIEALEYVIEHESQPTPLALDGATLPDNQQVLPADVLVGEGTLPEPPRQ